jgi:glycosyltransferase involved in cell wall biosynthesis
MFHPKGSWPYSGSERRFCALTQEWKEMGLEAYALEPQPLALNHISANYVPIEVSNSGLGIASQLASWVIRAVRRGVDVAHKVDFDLVYATNNNLFNLIAGLWIAKQLRLPCVAVVHHLRWVDYRELGEPEDSSRLNPSLYLRSLRDDGLSVAVSLSRVIGGYLESKFLPKFDGFIVVSKTVATQLRTLVQPNRIFIVGNAPFTTRFDLQLAPTGSMTALFVGRVDEGKGTAALLNAWEKVVVQCPLAYLHIVGDGILRKGMIAEANRRGLGMHLGFRGFLDDSEVAKLRSQSRFFITLSRTEGFGMALAEALAAGLPVIAWDTPPLREIFGECPAVFLCHQGSILEIAAASVKLLTIGEDEWRVLSNQASSYSHRFSWEEAARKELRALETVMEVSRSSR